MKIKLFLLTIVLALVLGAGVLTARTQNQSDSFTFLPVILNGLPTAQGHESITSYDGPATCVACHRAEAEDMHGSVHYQMSGPTPNVTNINGTAGKNDGAFNTYCGTIETSRWATCAGCHAGYGQRPQPEPTTEQLNNVDCLMCHQDDYARTAAGPYEFVAALDANHQPRTIRVPIEDENGFFFMPDETKMVITPLEAARTVHATTRTTCLRCHAGASGSDGGKRGDISSVTASPPLSSDVHMSPQGQDFTCAVCHDAGNHLVNGRGLDLRPNDVADRFSCENCHTDRPHGDYDPNRGERRDVHAARVACQSCHIPTFAKDISTEMERDWLNPFYSPAACGGQGGWKPEEIRDSDVVPTYEWFDGTSEVYNLGQVPTQNADGEYALGVPLGDVASTGAKLYPMKEHRSISALHDATSQLVPHSTFTFFTTGDYNLAVQEGMAQAGMTGSYTIVPVHTFQTINHGVEIAQNALECGDCHDEKDYNGGPARMDLQADLGYELKGATNQVCTQCHGNESSEGFDATHKKHVREEQFDCSYCHTFSRPDRGLEMP